MHLNSLRIPSCFPLLEFPSGHTLVGAAVDNSLFLQHPLFTEMTNEIFIPKQRLRRRLKVELSCFSVSLSCLSVCDRKEGSMPGFPVLPISHNLLKFMSIGLLMSSNHLILCQPLLLLPSIFPRIRVFFFFFNIMVCI